MWYITKTYIYHEPEGQIGRSDIEIQTKFFESREDAIDFVRHDMKETLTRYWNNVDFGMGDTEIKKRIFDDLNNLELIFDTNVNDETDYDPILIYTSPKRISEESLYTQ